MTAPQSDSASQFLGELPSASNRQKIEVSRITADDGSQLIELVEYCWGSGIGWYAQKRLMLDEAQVEALRGLLGEPAPLPAPGFRTPSAPARPAVETEGNVLRLRFQ